MRFKTKLLLLGVLASGLPAIWLVAGVAGPRSAEPRASFGAAAGEPEVSIADVPVKSFKVENANMAEVLLALRISDVNRIVIGFERLPHLPDEKGGPISLALTNATVGQVVQRLCQADPRYEYQVIDGSMVDVRPKDATTDPSDLLNIRVHDYKVDANITAGQAIDQINGDAPELRNFLQRKLDEWSKRTGEPLGFPGSIMSGNMPPPRFRLHLLNVTGRQILDAISLKSVEMFRQGPGYGPNGMPLKMAPTGWEYDFTV
ncbi:MAG: hypothetical protein ACRD3T_17805, partial [Terriglobia bacterium]